MRYIIECKEIRTCCECPLSKDKGYEGYDFRCELTNEDINDIMDNGTKPDSCPLIKVEENYGSPVMG